MGRDAEVASGNDHVRRFAGAMVDGEIGLQAVGWKRRSFCRIRLVVSAAFVEGRIYVQSNVIDNDITKLIMII